MNDAATTLLGVIVGFLLSIVLPLVQWMKERKALKNAITFELLQAHRLLNDRVNWLQQPVPEKTRKNNPEKIVRIDANDLLLWQSEVIHIPMPFFNKHYTELAGYFSEEKFMKLFIASDLIKQFEAKYNDMLNSFNNSDNKQAKIMAKACYNDLLELHSKLQKQLESLPKYRRYLESI